MNNEPVAWINKTTFQYLTELGYSAKVYPKRSDGDIPLYTHPAELTDEEIDDFTVRIYNCRTGAEAHEIVLSILRKAQE